MKKEEKDLFNPVFKDLKERLERRKPKCEAPATESADKQEIDEDHASFLRAMNGVEPISQDKEKAFRSPASCAKPPHPPPDDRRTAVVHLQGLLSGSLDLDITFSDEYIEGSIQGLSQKILRRLKRGQLPVQDHIDLHGLTRPQAEAAVSDFVNQSYKKGLRCVLIVHGRGLNSPDSFPVLKEGLPAWLGRGKTGKRVLAFSTARPYDGGTGATYVLLRKR